MNTEQNSSLRWVDDTDPVESRRGIGLALSWWLLGSHVSSFHPGATFTLSVKITMRRSDGMTTGRERMTSMVRAFPADFPAEPDSPEKPATTKVHDHTEGNVHKK